MKCLCGCGKKTNISTKNCSSKGWVRGKPLKYILYHRHPPLNKDRHFVHKESGCWIWLRSFRGNYGQMLFRGKNISAHRAYYEIYRGKIPKGKWIDHICRNTQCVNPFHLELVTPADNARRGLVTKLTARQVRCIRKEFSSMGVKSISEKYGVHKQTIWSIKYRKSWRSI